jgi:hypothetical protein
VANDQEIPGAKLTANAHVIRAGKKPRWGTPNPTWRKEQFIQRAILAINDGLPSEEPNQSALTTAVSEMLTSDPAFSAFRDKYPRLKKVSRQAVTTALQMLRDANR